MKKLKGYVAGKMTGEEDWNFPLFFEAEALMEMKGHDIVNPARMDIEEGLAWWDHETGRIELSPHFTKADAMRRDFLAMCKDRDSIIMLPGWEASEGANDELRLARIIGLEEYLYVGRGDVIPLDKAE